MLLPRRSCRTGSRMTRRCARKCRCVTPTCRAPGYASLCRAREPTRPGWRIAMPHPHYAKFARVAVAEVARSIMMRSMLQRRKGGSGLAGHVFRSTFLRLAGDNAEFASELIKLALSPGIREDEASFCRHAADWQQRELTKARATCPGASGGLQGSEARHRVSRQGSRKRSTRASFQPPITRLPPSRSLSPFPK